MYLQIGYRPILAVVLALLTLLGVTIVHLYPANGIVTFLLFFVLLYYYYRVLRIVGSRPSPLAFCSASVFSILEVVGFYINRDSSLHELTGSLKGGTKGLLFFVSMLCLTYSVLLLLSRYKSLRFLNLKKKMPDFLFFTDNRRSFFLVAGAIFICWLPYFTAFFPGVLTSDSISQIKMGLGKKVMTDWHPVIHTVLIGALVRLGQMLFHSYIAGIALYSLFQMLAMACIFSYALYILARLRVHVIFRFLSLLFFALNPVMAAFSVTMWKDVLFSGMVLLLVLFLVECGKDPARCLHSPRWQVLFGIVILGIMLLRSNGCYLAFLTFPFILFILRRNWKNILCVFLCAIASFCAIKGPIYSSLHIAGPPITESLSIPLQQIARATVDHGETMSSQDIAAISRFLPVDEMKSKYRSWISDPVKFSANSVWITSHKAAFFQIYVRLFLEYPQSYVNAYLCQTYGYWYPEASYTIYFPGIYQNDLGLHRIYLTPQWFSELLMKLGNRRDVPVISLFFSIGFSVWICLLALLQLLRKKMFYYLPVFIPVLACWLTLMVATPVFAEFRYIDSLYISLPVLIGVSFSGHRPGIEAE